MGIELPSDLAAHLRYRGRRRIEVAADQLAPLLGIETGCDSCGVNESQNMTVTYRRSPDTSSVEEIGGATAAGVGADPADVTGGGLRDLAYS